VTRPGVLASSVDGAPPRRREALPALDDLPVANWVAAPVRYMNGRDDDWFHVPSETRQL